MKSHKLALLFPVMLIAVGSGWLLSTLGVTPGVDWVWTLGLAALGVLAFLVSGLDKVTVVVGPFFLISAGLSILRQTDRLSVNVESPLLVIVAGVLLLVARWPAIGAPRWLLAETPAKA